MAAFKKYSGFLIVYTLLVILWGAWVRISFSGDGCGEHWPLCHGEFIPIGAEVPTWIEFSHRLSSGLYGFLVIGLVVAAFRVFPKGHLVRKVAVSSLIFTITEALLGAKLVLMGLVADNASVARAYTMALHLANSLILTGFVLACYDWADQRRIWQPPKWRWSRWATGLVLIAFILIGCTGALAALSDTLFPSETLWQGFMADFASQSHYLVRLRISHPLLATLIGFGLMGAAYWIADHPQADPKVARRARQLMIALPVALLFGYMTLFALSPTWMKLTHLLIAYGLWILLLRVILAGFTQSKSAAVEHRKSEPKALSL